MTLSPGTRLGSYEIVAPLGAGGMGEVYRARDASLGRDVAIKVLPEAFAQDADRLARFEREAKTLAALNHPNVAHVYGFEQADGVRALVMELVEGPTLADRIAQGVVPLDEALPVARQIAEALEAAHEQGIIHRDLKPANVKVRADGTVKVLDFGLAKALGPPEDRQSVTATSSPLAMTHSPTLTSPVGVTGIGMILGTAAYMAPEQAKGRPVSKASDIWAVGCVLYEMLTGRAVFTGDDVTEVLAAVVRADPDWGALPASTPRELRTLLRHCLHKDQRRRWQDAASLRIGIDDVVEAPVELDVEAPGVRQKATRRIALVAGITGLAVAAVAAVTVWSVWPTVSPPPPTWLLAGVGPAERIAGMGPRQVRPTRTAFALSPDGQSLIFVGQQDQRPQLYIRRLDRLEAMPIPGTDGADSPFFSPDGQWIGFWQAPPGAGAGEIRKVPIAGGPAVTLCRAPLLGGVSWGSHGRIVFGHHENSEGLWHVSEDGGTPEKLTTVDTAKGEFSHRLPHMLPGGEAVLFTIQKAPRSFDDAVVVARSLATGAQTVLIEGASDARYVPSGHLVYARMGALLAQRFDVARLAVTGGPIGVLDDVMHDVNNTLRVGNSGAAQFSVSSSGSLAYLAGGITAERIRSVVWIDRRGTVERVPLRPGGHFFPLLSPDDTQILLRGRDIYDTARGTLSTLASLAGPRGDGVAIWHPDGQRLTGSSAATGNQLWWIRADGGGAPEKLPTTERGTPMAWSPDGKTLAYLKGQDSTGNEIWLLSLADGDRAPVTRRFEAGRIRFGRAEFSPDNRYLAYESDEGGRTEIYVQPVSEGGRRVTISTNGGSQAAWAETGRELFYREEGPNDTTRMMVVDVTLGDTFAAGIPRPLFGIRSSASPGGASPIRAYDVTRDGRRFLMTQEDEDSAEPPITHVVIVQHWLEELRRMAPAK